MKCPAFHRRSSTFRRAPEAWTILGLTDHLVVVGPIYWQDLQTALKAPGGQKTPASDADILWYGIDRTNREKAIPTEVPKGLRDLRQRTRRASQAALAVAALRQDHRRRPSGSHRRTTGLRTCTSGRCSFQRTNNGISFKFERSRPIPSSRRNKVSSANTKGRKCARRRFQ